MAVLNLNQRMLLVALVCVGLLVFLAFCVLLSSLLQYLVCFFAFVVFDNSSLFQRFSYFSHAAAEIIVLLRRVVGRNRALSKTKSYGGNMWVKRAFNGQIPPPLNHFYLRNVDILSGFEEVLVFSYYIFITCLPQIFAYAQCI